jgi:methionyl-tRNA formyltransferase
MKVGFIGCVNSSLKILRKLMVLKSEGIDVVAVITKSQSSFNTDFADLTPLCRSHNIPIHYEEPDRQHISAEFFQQYAPDVIYCFGWSSLLGQNMLDLAPFGTFGFHPSPLPLGRGRHPIIWALALGLKQTASTFFKMDNGVDSGPIIAQEFVNISPEDNAGSLYEKILAIACSQSIKLTRQIASGQAKFSVQDHSKATYWRKRSPKDGLIDWRMRAEDINNLIRALAKPYPGATFLSKGTEIPIWQSSVADKIFPFHIEPSKILNIQSDDMLVKCGGESAIWLHGVRIEQRPNPGDYL